MPYFVYLLTYLQKLQQERIVCADVQRLCIELRDSFDACGVPSCGVWAGRWPQLGSSQAARSVISEGCEGMTVQSCPWVHFV